MDYSVINEKKISKISLGTVQLGMNYGIANKSGAPSLEQSFKILQTALDNGITSLDTASDYGNSENVIGEFFKNYNKEKPFITTKYTCTLDNNAKYAEVEREVITSVETSLSRMGIDKIDCLLLHNHKEKSIKQGKNVVKAFNKVKSLGLVNNIGVSVGKYAEEVKCMLEYPEFDSIQIPMNLFDLTTIKNGYFDLAKKRKINIFVRSVFFQGLFFLEPNKIENPILNNLASPYLIALREIAKKENMTITELAISYFRDMKGITTLVLGADNEQQVFENIKYLNSPKLSIEAREEIKNRMKDVDVYAIMVELAKPKG